MESFILLQKARDKGRNIFIIIMFTILVIIVSSAIYFPVRYGFSKLVYSDQYIADNIEVKNYNLPVEKIICRKKTFITYIAKDEADKERGLSIFQNIRLNEAMIFVFDDLDKHSFWMKNMKFPIDIVWFDENGVIVDIVENLSIDTNPNSVSPHVSSLYTLEFNAGVTRNLNMKIGDSCIFDFSKLK